MSPCCMCVSQGRTAECGVSREVNARGGGSDDGDGDGGGRLYTASSFTSFLLFPHLFL